MRFHAYRPKACRSSGMWSTSGVLVVSILPLREVPWTEDSLTRLASVGRLVHVTCAITGSQPLHVVVFYGVAGGTTRFFRCIKECQSCKNCPGRSGSHGRNRKRLREKQWWKLARQSHTSEFDKVVKVWAPSKSEVEQLEALLPSRQKHKMPPLTHNVWIRSLLQDGDVEPNPGPLRAVSLNGAGITNAIATVSYMLLKGMISSHCKNCTWFLPNKTRSVLWRFVMVQLFSGLFFRFS